MSKTISGLTLWQLIQAAGATMPFSLILFLQLANPAVLTEQWKAAHPVLVWMLANQVQGWTLASGAAFLAFFVIQVLASRQWPGNRGLLLGSALVVMLAWTLLGATPEIPSRGILPR